MPLPRRKDDFLPEVPPEVLGAGQGPTQIPYDQSNPPVADAGGGGAPPPQGLPGEPAAATTPLPPDATQPTMGLAALGLGGGTDQMSDVDLAQAGGDPTALLNDPTLTPEQRAQIEQQLLMAARRQGAM